MEFSNKGVFNEHKGAVYALCEAGETHQFFSGGSDRHVILWNLNTMRAEKVVSKSPATIVSLCYLKRYRLLLIGQTEGGVHVIDLENNKELKYLKIHQGYIFDIQYIESKAEVVFSSGDGSISVWSVPNFELLLQNQVGKGKNRKISYSPKREELAVGSSDNFVRVLNITDWSIKYDICGLDSAANAVQYFQDKLLIGTKNAHLHEFNCLTQLKKEGIPAHNWAVYDFAYNKQLNLIASASRDKTVKIWDAETQKVVKRFEGRKDRGHTHSVNTLHWSPFKNLLVSAGDDKVIRVWKCK